MINNITKTVRVIAFITAILVIVPSVTLAETLPSSTEAPAPAPAVTGQGNGGVTSGSDSAPVVTAQGNGGVSSGSDSAPAVTGQGNGGVSTGSGSAPAVTGQGNGGVQSPVTSTPSTPSNPSTGGSGTSHSSGTGYAYVYGVVNNPASCLYINDYMSIKTRNSDIEVTKLQAFLSNSEKLNVDINGTFDQKTFEAVKQFQKKYASEVLSPWGSQVPTGRVFYTTKKKINEIYCNSMFPLSTEQLSEINIYKNRNANNSVTITKPVVDVNTSNTNSSTTIDSIKGSNDNLDNQAGTVIKASFSKRIVNFVKWLFAF